MRRRAAAATLLPLVLFSARAISSRSASAKDPLGKVSVGDGGGSLALSAVAREALPVIAVGRSCSRIIEERPKVNAPSIEFESSRTLPGHEYLVIAARASCSMPLTAIRG